MTKHQVKCMMEFLIHSQTSTVQPLTFGDREQFHPTLFNSLAPGGFENIFQNVFFKLISWIDTLSNSCETALRSMPQNPSDDKSTLVQVMAWCRQAASHYLSQCCPRSLSPYGVTRPQWVNGWIIFSMLGLRLIHVSKSSLRSSLTTILTM